MNNENQQKIHNLLLLLNKEQQQIIDEAYEDYLDITNIKWINSDIGDLDDMIYDGYLFVDGDDIRVLNREEFIYLIKEVAEFSENWGLKIEEKELSLEERRALVTQEMFNQIYNGGGPESLSHSEINQWNIPTKLITITYKDTIIESYE